MEIKGIIKIPVIFNVEEDGDVVTLLTQSRFLNLEAFHNKKVEIKIRNKNEINK